MQVCILQVYTFSYDFCLIFLRRLIYSNQRPTSPPPRQQITNKEIDMSTPKPAPKPAKSIIINRNSQNGQFVPKDYARRHPATTETERYRKGSK